MVRTAAPPERIELRDAVLRALRVDDAAALARAVGESLDHLRPWMPWADERSADSAFQRDRLRGIVEQWRRGEAYEYGLFTPDESGVVGAFGLMRRRGPGTLEIGYWVHADAGGRGHATRAVAALTDVALQVPRIATVLIYCDEANARSAAIPRRLGYTMLRVERAPVSAPAETGRQQVWARSTPLGEALDPA